MKAYGIKTRDADCCPGHDSFPMTTYRNRRSKRARARGKKDAHARARATKRLDLHRISREVAPEIQERTYRPGW